MRDTPCTTVGAFNVNKKYFYLMTASMEYRGNCLHETLLRWSTDYQKANAHAKKNLIAISVGSVG